MYLLTNMEIILIEINPKFIGEISFSGKLGVRGATER